MEVQGEVTVEDTTSMGYVHFPLVIVRLVLAVFGVIANLCCVIVLTRRNLWSATSVLLTALVLYDSVFLLAMGLTIVGSYVDDFAQVAIIVAFVPLRYIAQLGSTYSTVALTVERFLVVVRPLRARAMWTIGTARRVVLSVLLFSVVFNLPRYVHYFLVASLSRNHAPQKASTASVLKSNMTQAGGVTYNTIGENGNTTGLPWEREDGVWMESMENTSYYERTYEIVYSNYLTFIFFYLIPYSLILVLNAQLLMGLRRHVRATQKMTSRQRDVTSNHVSPTHREDGLTMIILGVTACFFICCLLPMVYNAMYTFRSIPETFAYGNLVMIVCDTMLCINSATNFFFYCLLGRRFRAIVVSLLCPDSAAVSAHMRRYTLQTSSIVLNSRTHHC